MSEKNAAAMLRNDTKTLRVNILNPNAPSTGIKDYTYVTHLNLEKDDVVVVPANNTFLLARVMEVDAEVQIQPNSDTVYKWVVAKVDFTAYEANMARNAEIDEVLRKSYQANARRSFQQLLLGNVTPEGQEAIQKLLG